MENPVPALLNRLYNLLMGTGGAWEMRDIIHSLQIPSHLEKEFIRKACDDPRLMVNQGLWMVR